MTTNHYRINAGITVLLFALFLVQSVLIGQNTNLSNGNVFDGEPFIAINPSNTQEVVVAWMGFKFGERGVIKTRKSDDGGKTWQGIKSIEHAVNTYTSADPTMCFSPSGDLYLAYIDYENDRSAGAIYCRKSMDAGNSWSAPVYCIGLNDDGNSLPIDRPWLVANNEVVFVSSMSIKGAQSPFHPYVVQSSDGGQSFSDFEYIDDDESGQLAGNIIAQPMPTPAISSDGDYYVAYPSFLLSQDFLPRYILAKRSAGSNRFTYNDILKSSDNANDSLSKKGYLLRSNPANPQHLAFFYLSQEMGDLDIFCTQSLDDGISWTNPLRVNDDPVNNDRMQDLVWANFNENGDLVAAWRDRRNAPEPGYQTSSEIFAAVQRQGEMGFGNNFVIQNQASPYDGVLAEAGNDFMGIEVVADTLHVVWGDVRTGKLNIWYQKSLFDGTALSIQNIANDPEFELYPNPAQGKCIITSRSPMAKIWLTDVKGNILKTYNANQKKRHHLETRKIAMGTYFIHVMTEKGVSQRRLLVESH